MASDEAESPRRFLGFCPQHLLVRDGRRVAAAAAADMNSGQEGMGMRERQKIAYHEIPFFSRIKNDRATPQRTNESFWCSTSLAYFTKGDLFLFTATVNFRIFPLLLFFSWRDFLFVSRFSSSSFSPASLLVEERRREKHNTTSLLFLFHVISLSERCLKERSGKR